MYIDYNLSSARYATVYKYNLDINIRNISKWKNRYDASRENSVREMPRRFSLDVDLLTIGMFFIL